MKEITRKHPVRFEKYIQAFIQTFNCNKDELEAKEYYENGPALIKYKNKIYHVDSEHDMFKYIKSCLDSPDEAANIPLEIWIEVENDIAASDEFIQAMLSGIVNNVEREILKEAITKINFSNEYTTDFWEHLYDESNLELFPKAIVVAAKMMDKDDLAVELMRGMVANGKYIFPEMDEEFFSQVIIDKKNIFEHHFYIFSADPDSWDED
jgi:hypothetical protein